MVSEYFFRMKDGREEGRKERRGCEGQKPVIYPLFSQIHSYPHPPPSATA